MHTGLSRSCPPHELKFELCSAACQGLAKPALSKITEQPTFYHMAALGLLSAPLFSLYLNPNPRAEPAGQLQFGGLTPHLFTGALSPRLLCGHQDSWVGGCQLSPSNINMQFFRSPSLSYPIAHCDLYSAVFLILPTHICTLRR